MAKVEKNKNKVFFAFIDNWIKAAQGLTDEEIDGIVSGELEYRLVDRP